VRYRKLGSGPLDVSELSFGTWLTVAGGIERDQAIRCIHAALDCGVTFFDSANQYGAGESERIFGEALRCYPRDRCLIATKLYFPVGDEPDYGLSSAQIEKQMIRSLQRLGMDYVDLYRCQRYDNETPLEETMTALDRTVRAGKVRAIGFSEWTAEQIEAASGIAGGEWAGSILCQPTAVLDAVAEAGGEGVCCVCPARDREPGVFAAGARGTHGQVCTGYASARRQPRGQRTDENVHGDGGAALPVGLSAGSGCAFEADCGGTGIDDGANGAGMGVAPAGGGVGDYRGIVAGAGGGECVRGRSETARGGADANQ
jgi:hypothetical protein